jgi:hypothetical protein
VEALARQKIHAVAVDDAPASMPQRAKRTRAKLRFADRNHRLRSPAKTRAAHLRTPSPSTRTARLLQLAVGFGIAGRKASGRKQRRDPHSPPREPPRPSTALCRYHPQPRTAAFHRRSRFRRGIRAVERCGQLARKAAAFTSRGFSAPDATSSRKRTASAAPMSKLSKLDPAPHHASPIFIVLVTMSIAGSSMPM